MLPAGHNHLARFISLVQDSAGNKALHYGVVFIEGGGGEDCLRATAIRAPREEGWGLASGYNRNGENMGKRRGKTSLFSRKKNDP